MPSRRPGKLSHYNLANLPAGIFVFHPRILKGIVPTEAQILQNTSFEKLRGHSSTLASTKLPQKARQAVVVVGQLPLTEEL